MIRRLSTKRLLHPEGLSPSRDDLIVIGVFNPGAVKVSDEVVLVARIAEKPRNARSGFVGLPRHSEQDGLVVDWVNEAELDQSDPRVVRHKASGLLRLTSISHLRVFRGAVGNPSEWESGPSIQPESKYEEFGIEDPRITSIDGTYWITYAATSRHGTATALASTDDFLTFRRHGLIYCPENKDVVLFPQKIQGEFLSLHRPSASAQFGRPQMWLARSHDLIHWGQHAFLAGGVAEWESDRVGAGAPPIALDEGWLEIYHGSRRQPSSGVVGAYSVGALLLDYDYPARVLRRSSEPIMQPAFDFEQCGFVPNVIFPTGIIAEDDALQLYYGAADSCVGVVEFSRRELLAALK